jgi:hypothetical protein
VTDLALIPPERIDERYEEVKKRHAAAVRRERRFDVAKTTAIIGLGGLCAALGLSNMRLAEKAANVQVVYATLRDDGTLTNSVLFSSLPDKDRTDSAVINSLWTYVQARECYSRTAFPKSYYIAQAMSDARVGREWRDYVSLENKQSPQRVYGERAIVVQCSFVKFAPIGSDGDRYEFTFDRWEEDEHGRTPPVRYAANLLFRTGVYAKDPQRGWVDKVTFNAPGVQVIEYPGAKPEGVAKLREAVR